MTTFSERHGYELPDAEIAVRHEAPSWLRVLIVEFAYEAGFKPSDLRSILCRKLMESPSPANWSEFPNIDSEVYGLMHQAPWFFVYDIVEDLHKQLVARGSTDANGTTDAEAFTNQINLAFRKKGVGWQFVEGEIQVRGPEIFEQALRTATDLAMRTGREVARHELHEALRDLSRRPNPELTGAIQHSMAALECVASDVTQKPNLTLGECLKKSPSAFPAPLNMAVEKLWGYASEYGRHVREGRPPTFEEGEMVVGIAGSLVTYLLRKA